MKSRIEAEIVFVVKKSSRGKTSIEVLGAEPGDKAFLDSLAQLLQLWLNRKDGKQF